MKHQGKTKRDQIRQSLKGTLKTSNLFLSQGSIPREGYDRSQFKGQIGCSFQLRFQILQKIGQGSSGSVYKCRSKEDGRFYAVKITRGGEQMLMIAKKQFKTLNSINHPLVIKTKCLFLNEIKQKIHKVLQYFPHPSLQAIENKLSKQHKKHIIKHILDVTKYLHQKGICHRDLKPENILYDINSKDLRLIDFGISKKNPQINNTFDKMWTITGTIQYMAPEMLSGGGYDLLVDCWAIGIMTFKLFYGKFPFDSEYKSGLIEMIRQKQPIYPQGEVLLNNFIKNLIKKKPQQRLTAKEALNHPWIQKEIQLNQRSSQIEDQQQDNKRLSLYEKNIYIQQLENFKEQTLSTFKQNKIYEDKKN